MPQPAPAPRCGPVASRAQGRAVGEGSQVEPKQQLDIAQVPSPANALWKKRNFKNPLFFAVENQPQGGPLGAFLGSWALLGQSWVLGPPWGPLLERAPTRISKFEPRGARFEALWPSGALLVATAGRARKTGQFWTPGATRETKATADARNKSIYLCVYIHIHIYVYISSNARGTRARGTGDGREFDSDREERERGTYGKRESESPSWHNGSLPPPNAQMISNLPKTVLPCRGYASERNQNWKPII